MTRGTRSSTCRTVAFFAAGWLCYASVATAGTQVFSTPDVQLRVPVTSYQEGRFKSTIKQERDYSCGSAAVATLLTYHYEFPVSEHDVFMHMYEKGDQQQIRRDGFSLLDMKRYLEAEGFRADGFRLSLDELAQIGVPAITLINDNGYRHFVVIKGVERRYVLLGDPARGTRAMARNRFEKMWNGITFIIRTHRLIATNHFNRPEEWQLTARAPIWTTAPRQSIASLLLNLPRPYEF